jgi:predicted solute-binding protein
VGIVGYQNSAPLVKHLCPQKLELRYGHPSEVACWLREGEVDLALLPVAALLNDQIDGVAEPAFRVIPDLAIGCHGSVDSVLIAAESPPEEWTHVLLDKVSRTSVCLARLLLTEGPLADRVPADLKILEVAPGTGLAQARGTRATVVIGDQALALSERFRHRIDLGTAWTDWTGLPFVFALWVGRKDLDLSTVECVRSAGLRGLAELRSGDLGSELSESTLDYLRTKIRYELDDAATMGLMRFAALGKRAGLLAREHFCLFPPATETPDPEQSCAKALHDLIAGSTDLNRLTLLAEHGSLLELMAAAGLEDSPGRDVSYQALDSPRQTRPEMTQMEDLGGLQLGATGIQEGPARFEAWLGIAQELPEIDLHILPGPETLPSHWALLLFRLRALQRPFMRSIVIEDHQEGPKNTTGAEWLMTVALARLACPEVQRFVVDSSTHGAGLSQVALHGGATDLGPEGTAPDLQGPSIERNIRLAGFEPMRRNSEWLSSSGTHHREDLERPLRRLDAPSQG